MIAPNLSNESRQHVVARLFARALLRLHRQGALPSEIPAEHSANCLEVSAHTRLTVVPAGERKLSKRKGSNS